MMKWSGIFLLCVCVQLKMAGAHILTTRFQLDDEVDNSLENLEKDLPVCETEDELIPHMQCFLFYTCENSEPKLTLCRQGLYFNTKTGKCDSESNVVDCVDGIRVLPGSKEPPFFTHINPFRSTTTTIDEISVKPTTTTETVESTTVTTTMSPTTTPLTKTTGSGRTRTSAGGTFTKHAKSHPSTVTKIVENETDTKTTPIPHLTTESKITTLRKYVEKFPIFSSKGTPPPTETDATDSPPTKKWTTTTTSFATTPTTTRITEEQTQRTTTITTTAPTTTTTTTTTEAPPTTTTSMPTRGCQPVKIIIHHYPGPCKAEFTCSDGSSFIIEHCTSHLLWRPSRIAT